MARHRQARGRTLYEVEPDYTAQPGAHRAEAERAPLARRMAGVAVAVGVVTGSGAAAAYAVTGPFNPMAGGADLGGLPDPQTVQTGEIKTVHAVNLGDETARILKHEQLTALQTFNAASGVAQDGFAARQKAAADAAAAAAEARKSPTQRQVEQWAREAIAILAANGTPITNDSVDELWLIIQKESNGNPRAINTWDSNAARGTPSKGLMQCIDPTFQAYKLPGHDDIYNPVDNIIAGVRYIYARYGGMDRHPGLVAISLGGGYKGY